MHAEVGVSVFGECLMVVLAGLVKGWRTRGQGAGYLSDVPEACRSQRWSTTSLRSRAAREHPANAMCGFELIKTTKLAA